MGETPTPDYEAGDQCERCFGIGKTFGDVNTPSTVKANFSGIMRCPELPPGPDPNGPHILTQITPCYYTNGPATFYFSKLDGGIYEARVALGYWAGLMFVFAGQASECSLIFTNNIDYGYCPYGYVGGTGGQCEISWGPEI